jgi:hypothetical protein
MPESRQLTLDSFAPLVGETFRVRAGDALTLEARLTEAESLGDALAPGMRAPFSLMLLGPSAPILPQRIYAVEHTSLGSLELFLVPLQPDGDGARYQVIFS